jgi:hypothetical protein
VSLRDQAPIYLDLSEKIRDELGDAPLAAKFKEAEQQIHDAEAALIRAYGVMLNLVHDARAASATAGTHIKSKRITRAVPCTKVP